MIITRGFIGRSIITKGLATILTPKDLLDTYRVVAIAEEQRLANISAEIRATVVPVDIRAFSAEIEQRVNAILAETRTTGIPFEIRIFKTSQENRAMILADK
jgi:hypothetical protein